MPEGPGSTDAWFAEVEQTVQFYDLDPMEVVWHGNYAKYFEVARCALLDRIGYNYGEMKASGYAWPVIDLHVRYLQPTVFGQTIVVRAEIVEWEHRLKLQYAIRDKATGQRLTKGTTMQVAVNLETRLMCLQSPPVLFERLGVTPSW
ncbi:MAG: acyl-CoA thioesterase [Phycisphaerae bacterium]|nr:acyl-CoA thioesterase [Gemmatimonadaceae bacterium]